MTQQLARYVVAIIVAIVIGQIVTILAATFIDLIMGHEVTGGRWPLNIENVIVACIQGAAVGVIAGAIARKRGKLISAIAIFLPLQIFILLEIIKNQDMSDYIASMYDTELSLWVWIALLPAMICGHFSVKLVQNKQLLSTAASVYGGVSYLSLVAFHLYTTYAAFTLAGVVAALITLATPPLSDIFWLIRIWYLTGDFINLLSLRLLGVIGAIVFAGIFLGLIGIIERRTTKIA
jgi:hypothetical protein